MLRYSFSDRKTEWISIPVLVSDKSKPYEGVLITKLRRWKEQQAKSVSAGR